MYTSKLYRALSSQSSEISEDSKLNARPRSTEDVDPSIYFSMGKKTSLFVFRHKFQTIFLSFDNAETTAE